MVDVNTNVFMSVCSEEKEMAIENSIKQKRRGLERMKRRWGGGGGADKSDGSDTW